MKIKVGDRVIYTPSDENLGVKEWAGITGEIIAVYDKEPSYEWGTRIHFRVDPEYRHTIGREKSFHSYSSRVTKLEIIWEV